MKVDADTSLMDEIAEAEAAFQPPDIDFVASSEFPIEPFSLREEREVFLARLLSNLPSIRFCSQIASQGIDLPPKCLYPY